MKKLTKEEVKQKLKDFTVAAKRKVCDGASVIIKWSVENKDILAVIVPAAITAGKTVSKAHARHKQAELKDLYMYDHSAGMYIALKRKLTKKDWASFNALKSSGYKTAECLEMLHLIK